MRPYFLISPSMRFGLLTSGVFGASRLLMGCRTEVVGEYPDGNPKVVRTYSDLKGEPWTELYEDDALKRVGGFHPG